jgi:hypothetical protein
MALFPSHSMSARNVCSKPPDTGDIVRDGDLSPTEAYTQITLLGISRPLSVIFSALWRVKRTTIPECKYLRLVEEQFPPVENNTPLRRMGPRCKA